MRHILWRRTGVPCGRVQAPTRCYGSGHLHFINCSWYRRQPWLASGSRRDLFVRVLEEVRQRYKFVVVGYVVMPEHNSLIGQ
jgi:putative transposase